MKRFTFLLCMFALLATSSTAYAEWRATVRPYKKTIRGLRFAKQAKVIPKGSIDNRVGVVKIRGILKRKGWGVYRKKKWVLPRDTAKRTFSFKVPIKGEVTQVTLRIVNAQRKIRKIKILVEFPDWVPFREGEEPPTEEQIVEREEKKKETKRSTYGLGIGVTSAIYTETDVDDFNMLALSPKIFYNYQLKPGKWDLGFNTYGTAYALTRTSDLDVRYVGVNLRFGYKIQKVKKPWEVKILFGWYYTTMIVTGNAFGFKNMMGPQIFPWMRRILKNGDFVGLYFKFSPIAGLSFSNREIASGIGYYFVNDSGGTFSINADYANLTFTVVGTTDTIIVDSTTYSLGVGFGF